jgi:transketolase
MVEINKLNARIYSKLGQSGAAFGVALFEILKKHSEIVVLSSDMSRPAGLDRFKLMYPEMFYNVGIAEQNLLGIASGMASEGKKPIVTAQAAFISMRSFEQIRQYLGYMKSKVVVVGISSGFALNFFGNSHYSIEDISLMRSIPGMVILSPSDAGQAAKAFEAAVDLNEPVYLRFTGTLNCPNVYYEDYTFEIGKGKLVKDGEDITMFATGSMVYNSLQASNILEQKGISVRVVDMHTIKPLDTEILEKYSSSNLFVSIEEHNIIGGLGTAISEFIASGRNMPRLLRLGVSDTFSHPGDYAFLIEQNRLNPQLIAEDVFDNYILNYEKNVTL